MSHDEIRIAIAEACGWKDYGDGEGEFSRLWRYRHPSMPSRHELPNYPEDLNAMHDAEIMLRNLGKGTEYCMELRRIIVRDAEARGFERDENLLCDIYFYGATARQRAEAFLRTLGKWRDSEPAQPPPPPPSDNGAKAVTPGEGVSL